MTKKVHRFVITVEADEAVTAEQIAGSLETLINIGLADAQSTIEDKEGSLEDAELATSLTIHPFEGLQARCLITVSGGVADYVCDDHMDVEIFDFDNYEDDPQGTELPPKHFADLAEAAGVPDENGARANRGA